MKEKRIKSNIFSNIVSHDISFGLSGKSNWYIVSQLFFLVISIYSYGEICTGITKGTSVGFIDMFLANFYGMTEYTQVQKKAFVVPFIILGMIMIVSFIVTSHIENEFQVFGQNIIIRSGSKATWWNSKCVCAVVQIIVFYVQYAISILVISLVVNRGWLPGGRAIIKIKGFNAEGCVGINVLIFFICIIVITIALAIMQLFFTIRFDAIVALIITTLIIVASCYYYSEWLPVNHIMSARTDLFNNGGINWMIGVIEAIVIMIVFYVLGRICVNRRDWLKK